MFNIGMYTSIFVCSKRLGDGLVFVCDLTYAFKWNYVSRKVVKSKMYTIWLVYSFVSILIR